jgi:hypothetical protein
MSRYPLIRGILYDSEGAMARYFGQGQPREQVVNHFAKSISIFASRLRTELRDHFMLRINAEFEETNAQTYFDH